MKKIILFLFVAITLSLSYGCREDEPTIDNRRTPDSSERLQNNVNSVNQWIYNTMKGVYLWNDKLPQTPNYSLNPKDFFKSILYTYDKTSNPTGDRFSWIQEDYVDLLNSLNGVVSHEIGFEYQLVRLAKGKSEIAAEVLYPRKGSDAYAKGVKRGEWIMAINGQQLTDANYRTLLSGGNTMKLTRIAWVYNEAKKQFEDKPLPEVTIQPHAQFAENPIYMDSLYTQNNQKIGYLVYNFFAPDKGDNSYSYDKQLMTTLSNIKARGANELVLDLRYNGGGSVSTAIALASALVKSRSTDNVFITSEYNSIVHKELLKKSGANYNKKYFVNEIKTKSAPIAIPSLNLPRLYVLTGRWTASASELVINGLKPYMDVTLVGDTTYGKNVGSISFYEENNRQNRWGMQPIVVRYANSAGNSDYTAGFAPNYIEHESAGILYEFGDTRDPLLSKALFLISGQAATRSQATNIPTRSAQVDIRKTESMRNPHSLEMYDDIRGEDILRLMKK